MIGTAGSPEKCRIAINAGCDHAVNYSEDDWVDQVIKASDGRKADVVYDSVGKNTFLGSLDCTAKFGMVVLYGAASGPAPSIDPELLNKKGCLFLTRPSVFPHNADPATFRENAAEVFDAMQRGYFKASIAARVALDRRRRCPHTGGKPQERGLDRHRSVDVSSLRGPPSRWGSST